MTKLDISYVLAPFHDLLADCQNNVLMGLRIVERAGSLPPPTPDELRFIQLSFGGSPAGFEKSRSLFKRWILLNGFGDVHKAIRAALERMIVFRTVERQTAGGSNINIDEIEKEQRARVSNYRFPRLVAQVGTLFNAPFEFERHVASYNSARNCLEHNYGVVSEQFCNTPGKDKLIIYGTRFKMFFKKGDEETPAEVGKAGPENAALMLGAEAFQIEFMRGQPIELSLRQFIDILNTCVFIQADITSKLK